MEIKKLHEEIETSLNDAINEAWNKYNRLDDQPSKIDILRGMSIEASKKLALEKINLLVHLQKEIDDMKSNVLVGNIDSLKGNIEALQCICTNLTDVLG